MKAKAKKISCFLGVLILGPASAVVIDHLIGISFKDVSMVASITHTVVWMLLGAIIMDMSRWVDS